VAVALTSTTSGCREKRWAPWDRIMIDPDSARLVQNISDGS
jgi:hypothetical protein